LDRNGYQNAPGDSENGGERRNSSDGLGYLDSDGLAFRPIPIGTFAGTIEQLLLVRNGEIVPSDTGDQGGGQN
jgi:hypothetical protein